MISASTIFLTSINDKVSFMSLYEISIAHNSEEINKKTLAFIMVQRPNGIYDSVNINTPDKLQRFIERIS